MGNVWAALRARPSLAVEALRTAGAFRSRRGILPSRPLLAWRLATAYGSAATPATAEDIVQFLAWRRAVRRAGR